MTGRNGAGAERDPATLRPLHLRGVVLPEGVRRDIWISDGRIGTEPVTGAETVADDGFLIPGLVDAHCHPGLGSQGGVPIEYAVEQAAQDRDAGTLLIRDCGVPIDTRPLQERVELPRIIRSGRHLALTKRYLPGLGIELDDPEQLPSAVAEQAADGDGWVKLVGDWIDRSVGDLTPLWPDHVLAEAVAVAHDAGARVTAHVFGEDALPGLVAAGIDCLEHAPGLVTAGLIDEVARRRIAVVPTLINIETFPGIADQAGKYPTYAAHMRSLHAGVEGMVRAALEAGIDLYVGTDAGGVIAHGRVVDEIEALHHAGMPPAQAVGAASWQAREWLGAEGISHGAHGDLLVLESDPRRDPSALRSPRRIVLRGMVVR